MAHQTPSCELWLFATLWSLRQYPTKAREWSLAKKFDAIRAAGFDGVFSPPIPAVAERGALRYLAVTSLGDPAKVQIPVLDAVGRRTPEYRDWLEYATALLAHEHGRVTDQPVLAVPELGHAAPAYGLSCFGDTWRDAQAVARDLRREWRRRRQPAAASGTI